MSKLAIISGPKLPSGLPALPSNDSLLANTGIDVSLWTPAELHLLAVKRALQLKAAYYGDESQALRLGILKVENAITGNINNFSFTGIQDSTFDAVNRNIAYAKSLIRSSDRELIDLIPQDQKFQSFGLNLSTNTSLPGLSKEKWIINFLRTKGLYRTDIDTSVATIQKATNDYKSLSKDFIGKYVDLKLALATFGKVAKAGPGFISEAIDIIWKVIGDQFNSFVKFRNALYDKFEPTAHHVLYEFIQDFTKENPTVQAKRINHRAALDIIARVGEIPRATMTLWTENGINSTYIKGANEPIGGIASIDLLRSANQPKIGVALVALLGAIAGALTAAAGLLQSIKGTPEGELMQTVNQYGTETNSASTDDFPFPTNQGGPSGSIDINRYLPYALVGAGALYFLTKK